MRHYVTFGQVHVHEIGEKRLDRNCVAVFDAPSPEQGRRRAFELFGDKFSFEYSEQEFDKDMMLHFPRGFVEL